VIGRKRTTPHDLDAAQSATPTTEFKYWTAALTAVLGALDEPTRPSVCAVQAGGYDDGEVVGGGQRPPGRTLFLGWPARGVRGNA